MGKLIPGLRLGVRIHTPAGVFVNGSEPGKELAAAVRALGYKLDGSKETLESARTFTSTMRSEQIDAENRARSDADRKAAQVDQKRAATQPDPDEKSAQKAARKAQRDLVASALEEAGASDVQKSATALIEQFPEVSQETIADALEEFKAAHVDDFAE